MTSRMRCKIKDFIPKLTSSNHKGSCGRIAVIGGSMEYTGAPYFAAMAAMKAGADLVHVFCAQEAAPVIKSYSPELIVHPLLDRENAIEEISPWLLRMHALVIGPGMGRDSKILSTARDLILRNKTGNIPIVIDADGLHLLSIYPDLLDDVTTPVLLTPNKVECERLMNVFPNCSNSLALANKLKVILLEKGEKDQIFNGTSNVNVSNILKSTESGSPRRCGGQGDVLAGTLALFCAWQSWQKPEDDIGYGYAAFAASELTKLCSHYAFQTYGRSMMAGNLLEFIYKAFKELYESD